MGNEVTINDEYQVLFDELRQNRQIQLQSFFATPIWLGVFFGLLGSSDTAFVTYPVLVLVPIPLVFINLLLFVDRRGSSDVIIAYLRTAIDQELTDKPGWNYLLPYFRSNFNDLPRPPKFTFNVLIPQRFDFNVIVWCSYFFVSLVCCIVFILFESDLKLLSIGCLTLVAVAYLLMLYWIFRQSVIKENLIKAWEITLADRENTAESAA